MTEFSNFTLLKSHPKPLSDMAYYLRDNDKSWEDIEERRKSELHQIISDWQNGKHPALVTLSLLEATLGNDHEWSRLPHIVRDQNYFSHLDKKDTKTEKSPEEKYDEYMRKAEDVILHHIKDVEQESFYPSTQDIADLLAALSHQPSIDVALEIVHHILKPNRYRDDDFGTNKIIKDLRNLKEFECEKFSIFPYDKFISSDPIAILDSHQSRRTFEQDWTRDEYLFHHEIEIRRLNEIIAILEEWKKGKNSIHILQDILQVGLSRFNTPYYDLFNTASNLKSAERDSRADHFNRQNWSEDQRDRQLARSLKDQEELRLNYRKTMREFKPEVISFRGAELDPEFAKEIDSYIEYIRNSDSSSLDIIRNIAETMLVPVQDIQHDYDLKPDAFELSEEEKRYYRLSSLSKIVFRIEEKKKEEKEFFEKNRPMGELETQSEDETREPLKEIFRRRALGKQKGKQLPILCNKIQIDPSGSGAIKAYESDGYSDRTEEEIYGTTIARITTYNVSLIPNSPDDLMKLYGYTRWGVKQIAKTEHDFEIPFDYDARGFAYVRPKLEISSEYDYKKRRSFEKHEYSHCYVNIVDGKIEIDARLDLDDVWKLYYLLEDIIEPNRQVAEEMDKARRLEERGMLEQKADMNCKYSNSAMRPEDQMGSLDDTNYADYVPEAMNQTLSLYALGEIDEKQLLQRIVDLAHDTLQGRMIDSVGAFPTYLRLTDSVASSGGAVMPYNDAVKERTRDIMMVMTGTLDKDRPLFPALIARVNEISRPLRDELRGKSHDVMVDLHERIFSRSSLNPMEERFRFPFEGKSESESFEDDLDFIDRNSRTRNTRLGAVYDLLEKWKQRDERNSTSETNEQEQARNLSVRANLALRSPDVGLTSNRSWRGTNYVSKAKDSLWVRKDLPRALARHFKRSEKPDMRTALLAITSELKHS